MSSTNLKDAYAVLNLSANATDAEVKTAYRRLINRHHPDKLLSQGLPQESIQSASHKAYEIKDAYDRIRKARRL